VGLPPGGVVWEVLLAGEYLPFTADEQRDLEEAYAHGKTVALIRNATRQVALVEPFEQRAAGGQPPCKVRPVRRRAIAPPTSGGVEGGHVGGQGGGAADESHKTRRFPLGSALEVRFTRYDAWAPCFVKETREVEDIDIDEEEHGRGMGRGIVQHLIELEGGDREWIDLGEVVEVRRQRGA
jgi:hypothetical protein